MGIALCNGILTVDTNSTTIRPTQVHEDFRGGEIGVYGTEFSAKLVPGFCFD